VTRTICLSYPLLVLLSPLAGCPSPRHLVTPSPYRDRRVEVWGREGRGPGEFIKPRAVVCNQRGQVYVADSTGRIQQFTTSGKFVRQWRTPQIEAGKPESMGLDPNGNLLVPDTHYYRMLVYSEDGKLLRQWGQRGDQQQPTAAPGNFIFLNGATATADGRRYITEYGGGFARVQEFTREGKFIRQFASYGTGPGQFRRPGGPCIARDGTLLVADTPNHRVHVFALDGKLIRTVGSVGRKLGELSYPYGVATDACGNFYVAEWGNHRVQKFDANWKPLAAWGRGGTQPGELYHPWGVAVDETGAVYVADHENNRVQKIVGWLAG